MDSIECTRPHDENGFCEVPLTPRSSTPVQEPPVDELDALVEKTVISAINLLFGFLPSRGFREILSHSNPQII